MMPVDRYYHESLSPVEGYDIIGDVHGCAATLERLLLKMGYQKVNGIYQHPHRRAIFLGDVVDRGPHIREALLIVYNMVQHGHAHMILGNHEYNAITYCKKFQNPLTGAWEYMRPHTPTNSRLIAETLGQFEDYPEEWESLLEWMRQLPLFMEFGEQSQENCFRVVHACWDHDIIAQHKASFGDGRFNDFFLQQSAYQHTYQAEVMQLLTRGITFPLPEGVTVVSADGYQRHSFRTKFWAESAQTYGDLLFQPDPIPAEIAALPISTYHRQQMVRYGLEQPPLFIGHYWLKGRPEPIVNNIACLDYSAVKYGKLVAYRMDGEQALLREKFVWEYVDP